MGYTKIIRSGDLLEVYKYEKNLPIRRKARSKRAESAREEYFGARPRNADSIRRATKSFRRIVRSNLVGPVPPTLFTLTMYQKLSYRTSSRIFTKFIARLRRIRGSSFRYIAVPEFQSRGAVHWHLLMWGFYEEAKSERTTRYFSRLWQRGFVDCLTTDGHPKLSGYLAKYMSKTMSDIRLGGQRAYYTSHNVLRPMYTASGNLSIQEVYKEELIPVDNLLTTYEFNTQWLGRCNYQSFRLGTYARKESAVDDSQSQQA